MCEHDVCFYALALWLYALFDLFCRLLVSFLSFFLMSLLLGRACDDFEVKTVAFGPWALFISDAAQIPGTCTPTAPR